MPFTVEGVGKHIRSLWLWLLEHDNTIFGIVLGLIAIDNWRTLIARVDEYWIYLINGIYLTPFLSLLTISFSTLYVTAISVILLTASKPVARYHTAMPNLLAVLAGFGVYAFVLLPPAEERLIAIYVPLALLAAGAGLVVYALLWLRRSFSVTPQARRIVQTGPYAWVRHPMYVGNILSIMGLGLMIGTPVSMSLAAATCALQVCRAHYEDKLMAATFDDYEAYMSKVNAFIPRIGRTALAAMMSISIISFAGIDEAAAQGKGRADPNAGARCQAWHQKALSGQWFSTQDGKEFVTTEAKQEALMSTPACKEFFQLQSRCEQAWIDVLVSDGTPERRKAEAVLLSTLESAPACKAIIGFEGVCTTLRSHSRGKQLSTRLQSILKECADGSIGRRTSGMLRPAL